MHQRDCYRTVVEDRSCVISISSNPLHIARPSASTSPSLTSPAETDYGPRHCGTRNQPWMIEAPSGQKIKISLLDFTPTAAASLAGLTSDSKSRDLIRTAQGKSGSSSSAAGSSAVGNMYSCQYGYVVDKSLPTSNKRNVSVCGGGPSQQLTNVYTSASNMVELVLPPNAQLNFLLRMQGMWRCVYKSWRHDVWLVSHVSMKVSVNSNHKTSTFAFFYFTFCIVISLVLTRDPHTTWWVVSVTRLLLSHSHV